MSNPQQQQAQQTTASTVAAEAQATGIPAGRDMDYSNAHNLADPLAPSQPQPLYPGPQQAYQQGIGAPVVPGPTQDDGLQIQLSAYRNGGTVTVYADGTDLNLLDGYEVKHAAYHYRLGIGMAGAGIQPVGGMYPLDERANPKPLVQPKGNQRVFRREFQLNPGL